MNALLRRELRRLAPYALATTVLGFLVVAFGSWVVPGFLLPRDLDLRSAFTVALALGAGVLAVATVAPDRGSGGVAFLARLPLSPGRALAVKAGSALLLLAGEAAVLLVGLAIGLALEDRPDEHPVFFRASAISWSVAYVFGASLLASVLAPRTMPALLAAPFVVVGFALAGALGVESGLAMSLTVPLSTVFAVAFALAFGAAAALAYTRGDAHRRSLGPAVLAALVLAPTLPLFVAGTATARSWTIEHETPLYRLGPEEPVASPDGKLVAVPVVGWLWCGVEERVFVVDAATGAAWPVPVRGAIRPVFSPDGKRLALHGRENGWVLDLATRALRPYAALRRDGARLAALSWQDGELVLPGGGRKLGADEIVEDNRHLLVPRAPGLRLLGTDPADGRFLSWGAEGIVRHGRPSAIPPLARPEVEALFAWPERQVPVAVKLSPSARRAVVAWRRPEASYETIDLATGARTPLDVGAVGGQVDVAASVERASFSPDERRVALEIGERTSFHDVATGGCLARFVPTRAEIGSSSVVLRDEAGVREWSHVLYGARDAALWSPDGRIASPHSRFVLDLETGRVHELPARIGALLAGERCLLLGHPLEAHALTAFERPHPVQQPGSPERR